MSAPLKEKQQHLTLFDQIISTLKFFPASDRNKSWQQYSNAQYGFSFEYPLRYESFLTTYPWGVKMGCACPLFDWFDVEAIKTELSPKEWWGKFGKQTFNDKTGINDKHHPEAYQVKEIQDVIFGERNFLEVKAITNTPVYNTTPIPFQRVSAEEFTIFITPGPGYLLLVTEYFSDISNDGSDQLPEILASIETGFQF